MMKAIRKKSERAAKAALSISLTIILLIGVIAPTTALAIDTYPFRAEYSDGKEIPVTETSEDKFTNGGKYYLFECEAGTETIRIYYPIDESNPVLFFHEQSGGEKGLIDPYDIACMGSPTELGGSYADGWWTISLSNFIVSSEDYSTIKETTSYTPSAKYGCIWVTSDLSSADSLIIKIGGDVSFDYTKLDAAIARIYDTNTSTWKTDGYWTEGDRYNGDSANTITGGTGGFWETAKQLVETALKNKVNNHYADQDAVNAAVVELNAAIDNLISKDNINATSLYEEIQKQEGYNRVESKYTPSSWTLYTNALTAAKNTLASLYDEDGEPTAINRSSNEETVKAVTSAQTNLDAATFATELVTWETYNKDLTEAQWDWDSMETLLALQPKQGDFTEATWNAYSKAKSAAQAWYEEHSRPEKADDGANYAADITGTIAAYQALYKGYYGLIDDQETITVTIYTFDGTTIATTGGDPYRAVETRTVDAGTTLYDLNENIAASGGKGKTSLWLVNGLIPSSNANITNLTYVPQHQPDIYLKDGDVLTLALVCVPGYRNVSGIGYANERADTWAKNIKLLRFVDANESPISGNREVPAGEQLTAYGQWSLTHPAVYDGKYNAAGGFDVYISAVSDEPDSVGLATVNTGVTTAADGSFSVSFLEEGYYAVQLIHTASVNSEKPAQITASETMIVHVTEATNLEALKQGYQAELTAAYEAASRHDFTEENWQKFEAAYASGQTAISEAETLSAANAAKEEAVAAMDAVQRIDHDGILTDFRAKLGAVYDEADKLDKRDVAVVAAMAEAYNALSDYQKGLLTAAEAKKVQDTLAVQEGLKNVEPKTYTLRLELPEVDGVTWLVSVYDQYSKNTVPQNEDGSYTVQRGWVIRFRGYGLGYNLMRLMELDADGCYISQVEGAECGFSGEDTSATVKFSKNTHDQTPDYSAMPGWFGPHDFSHEKDVLKIIDGKRVIVKEYVDVGFYGAYLYAGAEDANITLTLAPWNDDSLSETRTEAIAAINAEVANLTRSEYTNDGWNLIIAAQNAGIAAVNAAESAETIEQAKTQAISNIQSLVNDETNLKDYEEGILGYVYVSVENNTFTTTTGGDTPAFTGYLVNNAPIGFTEDDTMMTLVLKALEESNFTWSGNGGKNGGDRDYTITYLAEVSKKGESLGEFDGANTSGWQGMLNDWFVNEGFNAFTVSSGDIEDGDIISVVFTLDGGKDVGNIWGDSDTSLAALNFSRGTLYPSFSPDVTEYTLMLPGTSANLTITPTAANKNYLVKAFLNKYNQDACYYKRTEKMPVTVGDTIYIGVGDKSWPSMNNNPGYQIDYTGTKYTIHVTSTSSAEAVITLIDKLSTVTYSNYKTQDALIQQARASYDGLDAEAKSQVTNLYKLENAEAAVKKFAEIDQVKALLAAIPDADKLTTSDKTKVQAARAAYDALSDEQKGYITMADVAKYNAAVEWLEQQGISIGGAITKNLDEEAASEVISLISAIGTVTADSGEAIRTAREAYDALTDSQKALVSNYDVLTEAEAAFAALATGLPFTDVAADAWYFEAVQYAYDNGLFNGTGATTFSPNAEMNRAMLATVLYRLAGEPARDGEGAAFTDVALDTWYTDAVAWANENGIVTGYGNGLFGSTDSITREQMAVMLYRYAKLMEYDTAASGDLSVFTDAGDASDWAVEALRWANAEGLITGRTATTIVPQGTATHAEVATILMRFLEGVAEEK